jgi:dihydropteroate synthase
VHRWVTNNVPLEGAQYLLFWGRAVERLALRDKDREAMTAASKREIANWRLRTRSLSLGARTLVMGVVNITPDSFSDGGLFLDPAAAVAHALRLLDDGADLLDLGAESTRPGSRAGGIAEAPTVHPNDIDPSLGAPAVHPNDKDPSLGTPAVSAEEERARLLPVLEGILKVRPDAIVSVDTYKAATARLALEAGAEIVNDVSGFTWDAEMAAVCASFGAGVVMMHTRGRPDEWRMQTQLSPDALMKMVREGLAGSLAAARAAGIPSEAIVLDPGYGFGKRFDENYALLARQAELLGLGSPLLAGVSRKSFLWHTLAELRGGEVSVDARDAASLVAMTTAILNGASIVRVHAVRAALEAARVADAILNAS